MAGISAAHGGRKKSLRLLAWAEMPTKTADGIEYVETFSQCERCSRGCKEPFDVTRKRNYRCTMASSSSWGPPDGAVPSRHFGGWEPDDEEPVESNEEGCPGGWYRCTFVWSLGRYLRPVSDGHYSENLHLSRTDDPLVIDAIHYFESERSRWRGWSQRKT